MCASNGKFVDVDGGVRPRLVTIINCMIMYQEEALKVSKLTNVDVKAAKNPALDPPPFSRVNSIRIYDVLYMKRFVKAIKHLFKRISR